MKKDTIENMQALATLRGGKCLSEIYVNSTTNLLWQCSKGHEWEAAPSNVKHRGSWCPTCSKNKALTIDQMQEIAKERKGSCLSKEYKNAHSILQWQCSQGHEWPASFANIKGGKWCPTCSKTKKGTIEEMQALATSRGGRCLSETYVNNKTKLEWECSKGHKWPARPREIKHNGSWCPECAENKRGTIEEMQDIAASRGGKCLSEVYVNSSTELLWQCAKGHVWPAVSNNVKAGKWCLECSGSKRGTIEEMQKIAASHGGKCLFKNYANNKTELLWECTESHTWKAVPNNVRNNGTWCPYCGGSKRLLLKDMQILAASRGGKCLSKKYTNVSTRLLWKCAAGHKWKAVPNNIRIGTWCSTCSKKKKLTIEKMHSLAASRGGRCLSKKYINARTPLQWQCSEGHNWPATPNNINNNGQWCPRCSAGLGERICREFFEQLFDSKFSCVWPEWLKTKAGNKRQLDGYSEEFKIAFEHQGSQHYRFTSKFHKDKSDLDEILNRDKQKLLDCLAVGVLLIQVPSVLEILGVEKLKEFIKNHLIKNDFPLPDGFEEKQVILKEAYSPKWLKAIREIIEGKEGNLLSEVYLGAKNKIKVQCKDSHIWDVTPNDLKQGNWCPECKKRKSRLKKRQP